MTRKISDILIDARQLITDPTRWIREDFSYELNGNMCYCSLGAVAKVQGIPEYATVHGEADKALKQAVNSWFIENKIDSVFNTFAVFNDQNNHATVLKAFDNAILIQQTMGN